MKPLTTAAHILPRIRPRRRPGRAFALCSLALAATNISTLRATTIYTDQTTFLNNVQPGYYLETFDSLPTLTFLPSPLSFSGNGFTYTANAPGVGGFNNVGAGSDVWLSTGTSGTDIIFNLTSGNVTAIGGYFFLTSFSGIVLNGTITATLNDGSALSVTDASSTSFVGFTTSSPILSLTLTPTVVPERFSWATVNDFVTGAAVGVSVPEGGGGALLLSFALAALCFFQRTLRSPPRQ